MGVEADLHLRRRDPARELHERRRVGELDRGLLGSSRTAARRCAPSPSPSLRVDRAAGEHPHAAHEARLRRAPHEQHLERSAPPPRSRITRCGLARASRGRPCCSSSPGSRPLVSLGARIRLTLPARYSSAHENHDEHAGPDERHHRRCSAGSASPAASSTTPRKATPTAASPRARPSRRSPTPGSARCAARASATSPSTRTRTLTRAARRPARLGHWPHCSRSTRERVLASLRRAARGACRRCPSSSARGGAAAARRRARADRRDGVVVVRDPRLPPPGARRGGRGQLGADGARDVRRAHARAGGAARRAALRAGARAAWSGCSSPTPARCRWRWRSSCACSTSARAGSPSARAC